MTELEGQTPEAAMDVLIVSADPDAREIFTVALRYHGFRVRALDDPDRVLAAALEQPPSVVITNFPLRLADGRTVTDVLRGDPRTAGLPILSVTSHAAEAELAAARAAGVDTSLPMPVTLETLAAEVGRLVGRR